MRKAAIVLPWLPTGKRLAMDTETTAAGPALGTRPRDLDPAVDENVGEEEGTQLSGPPVLEPEPEGLAERFANRVGPTNPVRVFVVALLVGYALIVTAMVFLGLTLIHVVLPIGGLAEADANGSPTTARRGRRTPRGSGRRSQAATSFRQ